MQLVPYIMFNGTCEEALNFYAKALNGQIKDLMRFEGTPAENMSADKNKVMHSHFVADGIFFMASDGNEGNAAAGGGAQVHMSINCSTEEELNNAFNGLAEGAKITMPLNDTFWGAKFGMLTDKFGINWMFNYDKPR